MIFSIMQPPLVDFPSHCQIEVGNLVTSQTQTQCKTSFGSPGITLNVLTIEITKSRTGRGWNESTFKFRAQESEASFPGNGRKRNSCTPLIVGQWNVAHSRDSILQELFFGTARAWNMNYQGQKNIPNLWQDKAKQGEWNMVGQTPGGRWSMTCGEMKGPPICLKKGKRNKRQTNQGLKDN